jgi:hypothetical protein
MLASHVNDSKDLRERAAEMRASSKELKDNNIAAAILRSLTAARVPTDSRVQLWKTNSGLRHHRLSLIHSIQKDRQSIGSFQPLTLFVQLCADV